ncbi:class I SAM-dependent methyltransferase [Actinoplanes sp. NBRC 101535]|uniref:class I SAM-dependent methyltransferase n=1 Tax=Actinoplanes sp. NBRC 101535 TaxID=3032196 RepID=UPI0024A56309|nr:class I SAM-dependent methyltransferase [Actinoplanes sp. NBRC 101535]GLX99723.1 methyltransferase type 11 [Actinoplanes sp. NBRC 101535]
MPTQPHEERRVAESFGADAERYDRTRPSYPPAVIERIAAALPGPEVLDVGIGTGIAARQFRDAGCTVLGVEPDERMAAVAGRHGFVVETATFETWDDRGRTFDAVIAGQTWHWVDPVAGAAKSARVLRPGGALALFWNVAHPTPEQAEAFLDVYRRAAPDHPIPVAATPPGSEQLFADRVAPGIRQAGGFTEPEVWTVGWEQEYTRDEWLAMVPTQGGHSLLPPDQLAAVLTGIGEIIDAGGGRITVPYTCVTVYAGRYSTSGRPGPP